MHTYLYMYVCMLVCVNMRWIRIFPSPRLVVLPKLKNPVYSGGSRDRFMSFSNALTWSETQSRPGFEHGSPIPSPKTITSTLNVCVCLCLCVYVCLCLSLCVCVCVCLSLFLSFSLSLSLSFSLSLSLCSYVCLSVCVSVCVVKDVYVKLDLENTLVKKRKYFWYARIKWCYSWGLFNYFRFLSSFIRFASQWAQTKF